MYKGALQKEAAKLERQYELERAKLGTHMASLGTCKMPNYNNYTTVRKFNGKLFIQKDPGRLPRLKLYRGFGEGDCYKDQRCGDRRRERPCEYGK